MLRPVREGGTTGCPGTSTPTHASSAANVLAGAPPLPRKTQSARDLFRGRRGDSESEPRAASPSGRAPQLTSVAGRRYSSAGLNATGQLGGISGMPVIDVPLAAAPMRARLTARFTVGACPERLQPGIYAGALRTTSSGPSKEYPRHTAESRAPEHSSPFATRRTRVCGLAALTARKHRPPAGARSPRERRHARPHQGGRQAALDRSRATPHAGRT